MKLVQFQGEAVEKLVRGFKELIVAGQPDATMVLRSPTGSGKTVMMASMLDDLLTDSLPDEFVYIWASMGDLAHQSYEKLSKQYLPDSEYNMIELESVTAGALPKNTILFCNWEKLFQIKKTEDDDGNTVEIFNNVYVRIGESGRNLQDILSETRADGRKIVLIVDEAHRTYLGENSQKLVQTVIKPDLTIEVSATPISKLPNGYYEDNIGRWIDVPLRDVIDSGLIKNNTVINDDIAGAVGKSSTDTTVLAAALKQREVLSKKYKEQDTNINPLILVQLPTESGEKLSEADETTLETVEKFMSEQGITYDNGKLAIWTAKDKHPDDVKTASVPNDSPIEVLIFKQAIAIGWDCPRASILVMLRDIKSVVFEIQTVGRILRMPELIHYDDSALNAAYVYTNINNMALREDEDTQTFFKTRFSHRVPNFKDNFIWPNVYRKRVVGQRHRLNRNFRPILLPILDKEFGIEKNDNKANRRKKLDKLLEIAPKELKVPILTDVAFEHLDTVDQELFKESERVSLEADKPYIERTFGMYLKSAASPYAPHDSSRILKDAFYKWFSDNDFDDEAEVQRIIACSQDNQTLLSGLISDAKQKFAERLNKETALTFTDFHIPEEQEFGENYEPWPSPKHVLQPYYRPKGMYSTEERFEKELDDSKNVEWWYRNGVSEPKYFGVPYLKMNKSGVEDESIFYPDYIVKFKDDTIGIFDTKSGDTTVAGTTLGGSVDEKANGLQGFLREYDKIAELYASKDYDIKTTPCKNLWGGLVNVATDGHFELQGDAITQEMANLRMTGTSRVEEPSVDYDDNNWQRLSL